MVRSAFWLLFAFAAAVVLALLLRANHGNISILWPPYRIDLSSNLALVLAVVGFFVLHVLLLVLSRVFGLPQRLRAYRERRQARRANNALRGAALAWFEGRFDRAERLAGAATADHSTASVAALIAARSAHRLGAPERRDSWLRQAEATGQSATLLAEAEFALDDRRPDRALLAVDRLRAGGAEPRLALETSLATWRQFGRWEQVLETVRAQGRKSGKLSEAELDALRLEAYEGLLAASAKEPAALLERWRALRSDERKRRDLAVPTVLALMRAGETEEARKIAVSVLEREYDDTLVECYGALTTIAARTRLEQLERWRNRYGDRPRLLEMLGRVCASERLWGKAETYLLQSLAASDSVSCRVALAQLYEAIDRRAEASRQFQFAARLALGERPAMALTLEPARARGPGALGAPAHPVSTGALPAVATLPGAAAAAGGLQLDDDESLSPMARPAPIPSPQSAVPPVGVDDGASAAGQQERGVEPASGGVAAGGAAPGASAGPAGSAAPGTSTGPAGSAAPGTSAGPAGSAAPGISAGPVASARPGMDAAAGAGDSAAAAPAGGASSGADDGSRPAPDRAVTAGAVTGSVTRSTTGPVTGSATGTSDQAAAIPVQGGSSPAPGSPASPAREGRKEGAGEEPGPGKD